jgi:hypothetical protein
MTRLLLSIMLVLGILLVGLPVVVSAADLVLEPMPDTLQTATEGAASQDDLFFSTAAPVIKSLSNGTVPLGSQKMKVNSAYSSMKSMKISPERFDEAKATLAFLYYSVKAGEAYENYHDTKNSVASTTTGIEFYDLALVYYQTASAWWNLIAASYPKVTLYKLPAVNEPFPDDDIGMGTVLEGLKYPILMDHRKPDPSKPYQTNEINTTISRWIEDNIDSIPLNKSERNGKSKGYYFIMGDDVSRAKSTYVSLTSKNVPVEFYDTANYIDAFLYYISQAREYYNNYLTERTNIVSASDGKDSYDKSNSYYEQAQVALNMFRDKVIGVNSTATIPEFPMFDEVPRGPQLDSEGTLHDYWGGTSWS